MASGSATIGALRVELSLNSAQFEQGLKRSQGSLSRWQSTATVAFAAVAAAGAAAAVAIGRAVTSAANHADTLNKTAQKIGVTVEALSRLEWAARLSDISLEQLSTGLTRLTANMASVATGSGGGASAAFAALGISVTNASGQLRAADAVMADIADRFSRMQDGSVKTALAVQVFGRAGAEMIPLLNSGRQGLADMAAEADRLGITISGRTARAAEAFNDSLTRINGVFEGIANQLLTAVTPGMEQFAVAVANPQFQQAIVSLAMNMVQIATAMANMVAMGPKVVALINLISSAGTSAPRDLPVLFGGGNVTDITVPTGKPPLAPALPTLPDFQPTISGLKSVQTEFAKTTSFADNFAAAVKKGAKNSAIDFAGLAGDLSGVLGQLFGDSKEYAVAQAVLSGVQGVAKSLGEYPMPLGAIMAGLHAAAAVAAIANVKAVGPDSTSMPGGGNITAPTVPTGAAAGGTNTAVNITLAGSGRYSRDELLGLLQQLGVAARDSGLTINLGAA